MACKGRSPQAPYKALGASEGPQVPLKDLQGPLKGMQGPCCLQGPYRVLKALIIRPSRALENPQEPYMALRAL